MDWLDLKLVKLRGEFVRHQHDGMNEVLIVGEGRLLIDFDHRRKSLSTGEIVFMPKVVNYRPSRCRQHW